MTKGDEANAASGAVDCVTQCDDRECLPQVVQAQC